MLVCSRPQNQMVIYQWENKNWGRQKYETTSPPGIIIRRRGRKEKRGWVSGRQLWAVCQTIPLFFFSFSCPRYYVRELAISLWLSRPQDTWHAHTTLVSNHFYLYLESLLMTRMRAPFSSRILPMSERSSSTILWDSCFGIRTREKKKKKKRIRVNNLKDIRRQLRRRWKTKRKSRRAQDKTTNVLLYAKVTRPMRDLQERRGPFRSCYDCLLLRYHNSKP